MNKWIYEKYFNGFDFVVVVLRNLLFSSSWSSTVQARSIRKNQNNLNPLRVSN